MNCEMKLDEYGVYTTEDGRSFYKEQLRKDPAFSEEDVIGIIVIAAFLAAACWFAALGYHQPFFFLLVPVLFSAGVGCAGKKIYERFVDEKSDITTYLHGLYAHIHQNAFGI